VLANEQKCRFFLFFSVFYEYLSNNERYKKIMFGNFVENVIADNIVEHQKDLILILFEIN